MRRLLALLIAALVCAPGAWAKYPWPFKPFDRQHPIRGFFGDPRTVVRDVLVRNQAGDVQTPIGLCGRIELDVDAFDRQPVLVPGTYQGLPVAPAFVQWSMARVGGNVVSQVQVVADFRKTLPANSQFFATYARGTYENSPRLGREQYTGMP